MSIKSLFPTDPPSLVLDFANGQQLDPRVSFDRASTGSTASYMGPDGYIKYAGPDEPRFDHKAVIRTNYILYSEDVTQSVWTKQNGHSTTANTVVSPYGLQDADTITRTASDQYLYQSLGVTGLHTLSAWVKTPSGDGNKDFVMQHYNSTDGSIGHTTLTATEEWQRFNIQASPTVGGSWYPCIPSDINQDFHVWGVQVEEGGVVTEYIRTNSVAVTDAKIESTGLLIEEQRTNYSSTFNSSTNQLTSVNSTYLDITSTSDVNPNGSSAVAYTATYNQSGNQFHGLPLSKGYTGVTSNKTVSHSYFVKEFNDVDCRLECQNTKLFSMDH